MEVAAGPQRRQEPKRCSRSHVSGPPSSRERMGEPHIGERQRMDAPAGPQRSRDSGALAARSDGKQSIVPTNSFDAQCADACRVRVCGVDKGITLDVEDDAGHEKNRGLGRFKPGVAGLAADL
jgi:hypothetical protein